jgi:hypothetical protein
MYTSVLVGWFGLQCLTHFQQNFSYIVGQSALLVEETRVPGENHQPVVSFLVSFYNFFTGFWNCTVFVLFFILFVRILSSFKYLAQTIK